MEPKGRVTGFRSIYCKRSPSGSLARARYIHQAYRGYTIDLDPTLAAHARTRTPGGLCLKTQLRRRGTQTLRWVPEMRTACGQRVKLRARTRTHGRSARNERGKLSAVGVSEPTVLLFHPSRKDMNIGPQFGGGVAGFILLRAPDEHHVVFGR